MSSFIQQHASAVIGMLSGWDRLRLRGTLRFISNVSGLSRFLGYTGKLLKGFGDYALSSSRQIRAAALEVAERSGRPTEHLQNPGISKEEVARRYAKRDGIQEGLICVLTAVEPCWSFDIAKNSGGHLELRHAYRKCLHVYHYAMHPVFGFMHVRLQTWLPFNLHVNVNGREWLRCQMDAAGLEYLQRGNCFVWVSDVPAAQTLLDQQVRFKWRPALDKLARQANPALEQVLEPYRVPYYWSIDESEWATDLMFRSEAQLSSLYPVLLRHGMDHFGSREVMRFLGQRVPLRGNSHPWDFREVISDLKERPEGIRIKHRLGNNSVKMYNKQGSVLRVETTLNNMRELKAPRRENGQVVWKRMRKGVADARRRAAVSEATNRRYLEALAHITEPKPLRELTESLSEAVNWNGRRVRGLNLLGEQDAGLLELVGRGEFLIHGFRNRDLQAAMFSVPSDDPAQKRRRAGQITRRLRMLRAHGLIHKLPHTHRYVVSEKGRQVIAALSAARKADVNKLIQAA